MDSIYRENILDHYKHPRNKGKLDNPDIIKKGLNPLCGDEIVLTLKVKSGRITDVRFDGHGCAISQASASMLSEQLKGMKISDAKNISKEDVFKNLGIELSPSRIKCALLAWDTLIEGLNGS